jgi:hypothetical protein
MIPIIIVVIRIKATEAMSAIIFETKKMEACIGVAS